MGTTHEGARCPQCNRAALEMNKYTWRCVTCDSIFHTPERKRADAQPEPEAAAPAKRKRKARTKRKAAGT